MAERTLVRSAAGVRLERVEELSRGQKARTLFKLSTYRPAQPRYIADRHEAEEAFAREVTALMKDPVIARMILTGALTD